MIVDDEIIVRIGFQSCLNWEEYGCQVQAVCESTEEAIACIQKEVPDIVFTDIMMPGKNGIELVRYIRTNYPYIKVVVLSCMGDIEYVKAGNPTWSRRLYLEIIIYQGYNGKNCKKVM